MKRTILYFVLCGISLYGCSTVNKSWTPLVEPGVVHTKQFDNDIEYCRNIAWDHGRRNQKTTRNAFSGMRDAFTQKDVEVLPGSHGATFQNMFRECLKRKGYTPY